METTREIRVSWFPKNWIFEQKTETTVSGLGTWGFPKLGGALYPSQPILENLV